MNQALPSLDDFARGMLEARQDLLKRGVSFCVETTLATRTLLNFVKTANDTGYVGYFSCSRPFLS